MRTFILAVVLLTLVSCGGIVPDNGTNISAIRAGVPTVEFRACGDIWKGLAICTIGPDVDLSTLSIEVQGYYEGEVRLITSGCPVEVDEKKVYSEHQRIKVPLTGLPERDCLLTVTLSPRYKGWKSRGIVVEPIEGHVYIRRTSNANPILKTSITKRNVTLTIPSEDPGRVVLRSSFCDINYDEVVYSDRGFLRVRYDEITNLNKRQLCIINGASVDTNQLIVWYVARYSDDYIPLAKPSLEMTKRRLKVKASSNVSALVLNGKYSFKNEKSFKFDRKKRNILRLLTVKGRSQVGVWYPSRGEWVWK